jgi:hypothetical protein
LTSPKQKPPLTLILTSTLVSFSTNWKTTTHLFTTSVRNGVDSSSRSVITYTNPISWTGKTKVLYIQHGCLFLWSLCLQFTMGSLMRQRKYLPIPFKSANCYRNSHNYDERLLQPTILITFYLFLNSFR